MKGYCKDCVVRERGIFSDLLNNQKDKITCIMNLNRYVKRQILFLEGNSSHYIYAIKSGTVKIFKTGEDEKPHILRILNEGDLLAFDAIYSKEYQYSAETIECSEICMMRKEDFIALLKKDANLAIELIKVLTRELEEARCYIRDLTTGTAAKKIAHFLLSSPHTLTNSSTKVMEKAVILPLSRQELSEMLGLSPETISRTLSQFEKDRIVKVNGKKILICNPQKLHDL